MSVTKDCSPGVEKPGVAELFTKFCGEGMKPSKWQQLAEERELFSQMTTFREISYLWFISLYERFNS